MGAIGQKWINPFHTNVSFLYPLKTSEGGIEMGNWLEKRLVN